MIAVILSSVALAVLGQLCLKGAMNRIGRIGRNARSARWRAGLPLLGLGMIVYGLSTVLWLLALSRVELSFAFPFLGLSYVAIAVLARFVFGERLPRHRIVGSLLILLGVLAVSLSA